MKLRPRHWKLLTLAFIFLSQGGLQEVVLFHGHTKELAIRDNRVAKLIDKGFAAELR